MSLQPDICPREAVAALSQPVTVPISAPMSFNVRYRRTLNVWKWHECEVHCTRGMEWVVNHSIQIRAER